MNVCQTMTLEQLAALGIREAQRVQRLRDARDARKAGLEADETAQPRDAMRGVQTAANEIIRRCARRAAYEWRGHSVKGQP